MKKVWRIISVVLAVALALGMTAFAESEKTLKLSAGSAEIRHIADKALVEIPIEFEGEVKLTALQVEVGFSGEISFVEYKPGNILEGITEPAVGSNPVVIPFVDVNIAGVEVKTGTLATLVLEVPTDKSKNFSLIVKVATAADENYESIASKFETVNGMISVNGEKTSSELVIGEERETARDARKQDVIALKIDSSTAYIYGKTAMIDDSPNVVPYIKDNRTLVPLRFVSENLGAEVQWEEGWKYCYVVKGDKKIKITFNSADIEVNGEVITYDTPVKLVDNRTMVPIRFISEELGYDVKWNAANRLVIITPADNPWIEDGQAEKDVLEGILVTFLFNGIF